MNIDEKLLVFLKSHIRAFLFNWLLAKLTDNSRPEAALICIQGKVADGHY